MSVSADHYEKATVNGHPGALGNAKTYKIEMLSVITLLLKYYLTFITERFHCTSLLDVSLFRMLNDFTTELSVCSFSFILLFRGVRPSVYIGTREEIGLQSCLKVLTAGCRGFRQVRPN